MSTSDTSWSPVWAALIVLATVGSASSQSPFGRLTGEDLLQPQLVGPPHPTPADWLVPKEPLSPSATFLRRPWAEPKEVCEQAADDIAVTEKGDSATGDDVFCFWLLARSPVSSVFFQAAGSPSDTHNVRFKLTAAPETFLADLAAFWTLIGEFHSRLGWPAPAAPPDAFVEDLTFVSLGIQYRLWREDGDTPRLNLTMVFPEAGLSSTAFTR